MLDLDIEVKEPKIFLASKGPKTLKPNTINICKPKKQQSVENSKLTSLNFYYYDEKDNKTKLINLDLSQNKTLNLETLQFPTKENEFVEITQESNSALFNKAAEWCGFEVSENSKTDIDMIYEEIDSSEDSQEDRGEEKVYIGDILPKDKEIGVFLKDLITQVSKEAKNGCQTGSFLLLVFVCALFSGPTAFLNYLKTLGISIEDVTWNLIKEKAWSQQALAVGSFLISLILNTAVNYNFLPTALNKLVNVFKIAINFLSKLICGNSQFNDIDNRSPIIDFVSLVLGAYAGLPFEELAKKEFDFNAFLKWFAAICNYIPFLITRNYGIGTTAYAAYKYISDPAYRLFNGYLFSGAEHTLNTVRDKGDNLIGSKYSVKITSSTKELGANDNESEFIQQEQKRAFSIAAGKLVRKIDDDLKIAVKTIKSGEKKPLIKVHNNPTVEFERYIGMYRWLNTRTALSLLLIGIAIPLTPSMATYTVQGLNHLRNSTFLSGNNFQNLKSLIPLGYTGAALTTIFYAKSAYYCIPRIEETIRHANRLWTEGNKVKSIAVIVTLLGIGAAAGISGEGMGESVKGPFKDHQLDYLGLISQWKYFASVLVTTAWVGASIINGGALEQILNKYLKPSLSEEEIKKIDLELLRFIINHYPDLIDMKAYQEGYFTGVVDVKLGDSDYGSVAKTDKKSERGSGGSSEEEVSDTNISVENYETLKGKESDIQKQNNYIVINDNAPLVGNNIYSTFHLKKNGTNPSINTQEEKKHRLCLIL